MCDYWVAFIKTLKTKNWMKEHGKEIWEVGLLTTSTIVGKLNINEWGQKDKNETDKKPQPKQRETIKSRKLNSRSSSWSCHYAVVQNISVKSVKKK